jgi:hypothetical protein
VTDSLSGWVLDVAALVAFADRTRYAEAALATATHRGLTLLVPLPALSLAYDARPHHIADPPLAALLGHPLALPMSPSDVPPDLMAKLTEISGGDQIAAHVAYLADSRDWPVLTDRGELLQRIRPGLTIFPA